MPEISSRGKQWNSSESKVKWEFHWVHTKLVKRRTAEPCKGAALIKSCGHVIHEIFQEPVARLAERIYSDGVTRSVFEGSIKSLNENGV